MEENFSMEWKKIVSMEYGKIVFHTMPCVPVDSWAHPEIFNGGFNLAVAAVTLHNTSLVGYVQGVHKVRVHFKKFITLFLSVIEIICKNV